MIKIGLLFLTIPCLALMGFYLPEQASISDCLAVGGSFDYVNQVCDLEAEHPYLPFMARHPLMVNGGMLVAVLGTFLCIIGLYRPSKTS